MNGAPTLPYYIKKVVEGIYRLIKSVALLIFTIIYKVDCTVKLAEVPSPFTSHGVAFHLLTVNRIIGRMQCSPVINPNHCNCTKPFNGPLLPSHSIKFLLFLSHQQQSINYYFISYVENNTKKHIWSSIAPFSFLVFFNISSISRWKGILICWVFFLHYQFNFSVNDGDYCDCMYL